MIGTFQPCINIDDETTHVITIAQIYKHTSIDAYCGLVMAFLENIYAKQRGCELILGQQPISM